MAPSPLEIRTALQNLQAYLAPPERWTTGALHRGLDGGEAHQSMCLEGGLTLSVLGEAEYVVESRSGIDSWWNTLEDAERDQRELVVAVGDFLMAVATGYYKTWLEVDLGHFKHARCTTRMVELHFFNDVASHDDVMHMLRIALSINQDDCDTYMEGLTFDRRIARLVPDPPERPSVDRESTFRHHPSQEGFKPLVMS